MTLLKDLVSLLKKAEIPLFLLALSVLVIIFVLILTGHVVPPYLYVVLSAVLAGGLGIAAPTSATAAPALPAEVEGLVADLRKVFATLTEPAPAPSSTAPPAPLTSVPPAPPAAS